MSEPRQSALRRALQRARARWARPRTLWLQADGVFEPGTSGSKPALQSWAHWCQANEGQAAQLWVGGALLHHVVSEAGMPLADDAALQAYARQLLSHYHGAAAQRWPLAAWHSSDRSGACALHGVDMAQLQTAAQAHAVDLRAIRPAWSVALSALMAGEPEWARAPAAAMAFVEGPLLTWVSLKQGVCVSLRHARLATPTLQALAGVLAALRTDGEAPQILVLGYGLAAGTAPVWPGVRVLGRLDGDGPSMEQLALPPKPPAAVPQPDFLATGPRNSPLGWVLALTGLLVLATAGWTAYESRQAKEAADQEFAQLQNRLRGRPVEVTAKPVVAASPSQQQAQAEAIRAAREVAGLLQEPWGQILSQVETAGGGQVQWLGMDYTAGRAELRLEGLSADRKMALGVVDRLSALPGWQDVNLNRLMTAEQGLQGLRLDIGAKLQPQVLIASGVAP